MTAPRPFLSAPILALVLGALVATPALARPELCEAAIAPAARDAGIPGDVLLAIALTESGRAQDGRLRPWPWAANGAGEGHWFATRAEAAGFARALLARGERSFDLGCFQINWRWHGQGFAAPEELLDPATAARYAAGLLARLYRETGDWNAAAGAYHSRTPRRAARYATRFARIRATLDGEAPAARPPTPAAPNAVAVAPVPPYPLLAGTASGASLVPASLPAVRPLFAPHR